LHERILAWVKAFELRIALVKNCVVKIFAYFYSMACFCTCCDGTFVLLPKANFVGILLFFFVPLAL
jgi:hypothetical protein